MQYVNILFCSMFLVYLMKLSYSDKWKDDYEWWLGKHMNESDNCL
jgi:hypothetical protein